MEEFPFDEMLDFLKKEDIQDLVINQEEESKVPGDSSLVDHFMNDPQFWNTFLKEEEMKKANAYSHPDYDSMLWSHESYTLKENYASSSTGSDRSSSSPSHPSEICVTSASDYSSTEKMSSSLADTSSSPISMDESSVQLSDESPSPTQSNYEYSVNTIDIGADVIVVTSAEVYTEEEEEETGDSDNDPVYSIGNDPVFSIDVEKNGLEPLILSEEEKRLMDKEGVVLPKYLPLTKAEERELKRIRRKIRNKASAQNSRKRKKEYVDGLERRVKRCTLENNSLKQTVRQMQEKNKSLVTELSRLQKLLANTSNKPVQSSTCLMVLLCSFALLLLPNLLPNALESKDLFDGEKSEQKFTSVRGPSRTLTWADRSETPGKIHTKGFYKEENISNIYESPQLGSTPKHSEWSFAAGQQIEKSYYPMSDETPSFSRDFSMSEKKYVVGSPPPLQSDAESSEFFMLPPCAQEVIIDSSPE